METGITEYKVDLSREGIDRMGELTDEQYKKQRKAFIDEIKKRLGNDEDAQWKDGAIVYEISAYDEDWIKGIVEAAWETVCRNS